MSYTYYEYLGLIAPDSDATLEKLKAKLDAFYSDDDREVQLELSGQRITLTIDGYNFYIHYNAAGHVPEESKEIASRSARGKPEEFLIASSNARFEMHGDDDPDMDFFNDSLYVQEEMESFKNVFIYDSFSGKFLNC